MDRIESHTGTQMARMHVHGVGDSSNRPENASAMPNLPARGSKPHIGEPKWSGDQTDASDTCTYALGIASNLNEPANMSVTQDIAQYHAWRGQIGLKAQRMCVHACRVLRMTQEGLQRI